MDRNAPKRSIDFWQAVLSFELSDSKTRALVERVGSFCLTMQDLIASPFLTAEEKEKIKGLKPVNFSGINFTTNEDEGFPKNLKLMREPPNALMYKGEILESDELAVAIVGTRKPTTYGRAVARKFAQELARHGITIISGGAFGIDTQAHAGAIDEGGRTIAVLGSGVDKVFPAANRELFQKIEKNGALISQFAIGTKPDYWRFPARNSVIAGLARVVIVVEAPEKSGSLITASVAAEEGRHVFVIPANIDAISFRGSFRLINDGATLLYSPRQVFDVLGIKESSKPNHEVKLSSGQKSLLDCLSLEPVLVDNLAEKLNWNAGILLVELTNLEIAGLIMKTPGGYVKK